MKRRGLKQNESRCLASSGTSNLALEKRFAVRTRLDSRAQQHLKIVAAADAADERR